MLFVTIAITQEPRIEILSKHLKCLCFRNQESESRPERVGTVLSACKDEVRVVTNLEVYGQFNLFVKKKKLQEEGSNLQQ